MMLETDLELLEILGSTLLPTAVEEILPILAKQYLKFCIKQYISIFMSSIDETVYPYECKMLCK